jgi:hypothetical protein
VGGAVVCGVEGVVRAVEVVDDEAGALDGDGLPPQLAKTMPNATARIAGINRIARAFRILSLLVSQRPLL